MRDFYRPPIHPCKCSLHHDRDRASRQYWLGKHLWFAYAGLFIILPVFALYAEHLPGGESHLLIGIALGATD